MVFIPGLEGQYSVTTCGKVYSHKRGHFLTPQRIYSGYLRVRIRDEKKQFKPQCPLIHRLVAMAYLPNPDNKPEVHHKNAKRDDNRVENLEWSTREENNQAAWDSGNKKFVYTQTFADSVRKNMAIARAARRISNKEGV